MHARRVFAFSRVVSIINSIERPIQTVTTIDRLFRVEGRKEESIKRVESVTYNYFNCHIMSIIYFFDAQEK